MENMRSLLFCEVRPRRRGDGAAGDPEKSTTTVENNYTLSRSKKLPFIHLTETHKTLADDLKIAMVVLIRRPDPEVERRIQNEKLPRRSLR